MPEAAWRGRSVRGGKQDTEDKAQLGASWQPRQKREHDKLA